MADTEGMSDRCVTCGALSDEREILRLEELEEPATLSSGVLHLCRTCLGERRARSWSAGEPITRRLRDALDEPRAGQRERFAYLGDGTEAIHLLHLRPTWLHQHVQRY